MCRLLSPTVDLTHILIKSMVVCNSHLKTKWIFFFFAFLYETDLEKLESRSGINKVNTKQTKKEWMFYKFQTAHQFNWVQIHACVFSSSHDDKPRPGSWRFAWEKKKEKVLVHLPIVRNEQLGPTESERSEEWMSPFSSFSLSSGALRRSETPQWPCHFHLHHPAAARCIATETRPPVLLIHCGSASFLENLQQI